jgi:hypothetical protein
VRVTVEIGKRRSRDTRYNFRMRYRPLGMLDRLVLYRSVASYRELLADQRERGRILVTVELARRPTAAQRAELTLVAGRCEWFGSALRIASSHLLGRARGLWTNHRFDAWLRGFVRHTLPRLDAIVPVANLDLAIEGETRDYRAALG